MNDKKQRKVILRLIMDILSNLGINNEIDVDIFNINGSRIIGFKVKLDGYKDDILITNLNEFNIFKTLIKKDK